MNVFVVVGIVGITMAVLTMLISFGFYQLSAAVANNYQEIEDNQGKYKPNATLGFNIAKDEDPTVQFKEARQEAARRAALLPRGGNMRIGGRGEVKTASTNLENDPISAYKIATTHGWTGLGELDKYQAAAASATAAPVAAAGAPQVKRKLVPGVDYQAVEITPGMDPADRRKARIANAKAKMAAYKALKAAGADMVAAAPAAAAPAVATPAAAPSGPSAADVGVPEPVLIEITDDMDPADKRKARIANSKANSAYKKALKAAGVDLSAKAAPAPAAAPPPPVEAVAAPPAPVAGEAPSDIEKPDLIEITDDMSPEDKRSAKIANTKAKSAYKKALKAAGYNPKDFPI